MFLPARFTNHAFCNLVSIRKNRVVEVRKEKTDSFIELCALSTLVW